MKPLQYLKAGLLNLADPEKAKGRILTGFFKQARVRDLLSVSSGRSSQTGQAG